MWFWVDVAAVAFELEATFPGCLAEGDEEEGDLEEAAVSATPVPRFAAI